MKKILLTVVSLVMVIALFASCNSDKSSDTAYKNENYTGAIAEDSKEYISDSIDAGGLNENTSASISLTTDRKIIKTANMTVETKQFDEFIKNIEDFVDGKKGYIESKEITGSSDSSADRSGTMIVRIPQEQLQAFMQTVSENSTVTYENIEASDVTESYNDAERQIEALETEQKRLLELVETADSLSDILEIEARLTKIRYELDAYEGQIRDYDSRIAYSTVRLGIYEVDRETVTKKDSFGTKVSEGFLQSLDNIGDGFIGFAIGFLSFTPYLLLIAAIGIVVFVIIKAAIKRAKKGSSPDKK